ncbi:putative phage protein [Gottschalkia purinilytica]|uniref:Putative phage protein n=1 Tax=Gottschalkia purinilytica TaxID=1503 RepID=A0A0L0W6X3_GOTPU|nr:putative phage protein [Gottschalkia purinilytica]
MELEELKLFLRLDHGEEDDLLKSFQLSAEMYLNNAGINKNYENELYKLAIKILVSHWYENRTTETTGPNFHRVAFSLENIILQLQLSQGSGNNEL